MITWEKAEEIFDKIQGLAREQAIPAILELVNGKGSEPAPSPLTPSGAVPVYLKPNQKKKRKKKPGCKEGHPGHFRKIPEQIDGYKEHPLKTCPFCQTPLKKAGKIRRRYIEDLPLIQPEVTEHIIPSYWCPCCKKRVEAAVTEAMPNDNIGLHTFVLTAWQHYLGGISINYIADMLKKLSRFPISPGGLNQGWIRLARLLTDEYEKIRQEAQNSAVLHIDETGWRQSGNTRWLWCFTNKTLCYYMIAQTRASKEVLKIVGEAFRGIIITDFWKAYNLVEALAKQKCFFHLFSEFKKVAARNYSEEWKRFQKTLTRLLKDSVRLGGKKDELSPQQFERRKALLYNRLDHIRLQSYADKDCLRLSKRLTDYRNDYFTFLDYEDVSPYNNHAEQQMRKPVLWRRRCQQNRSDNGVAAQAVLMSIFRTAELKGLNPVEYVETLVKKAIEENHIKPKSRAKDKSSQKAA